jgi:hypothetical protein
VEDVGRIHDAAQAAVDEALANDAAQKRVDLAQEDFDRVAVAGPQCLQKLLHFGAGHVRCPASRASNK